MWRSKKKSILLHLFRKINTVIRDRKSADVMNDSESSTSVCACMLVFMLKSNANPGSGTRILRRPFGISAGTRNLPQTLLFNAIYTTKRICLGAVSLELLFEMSLEPLTPHILYWDHGHLRSRLASRWFQNIHQWHTFYARSLVLCSRRPLAEHVTMGFLSWALDWHKIWDLRN